MASYEVWHYISIGALVVAGIFLLLAVLMFFGYRIPSVISVLSGKARRKDLERIKTEIDSNRGSISEYYGKTGKTGTLGKKTELLSANSGRIPAVDSPAPVRPQPLYRDSEDVATDVLPQVAPSPVASATVHKQTPAESVSPSPKKFKFVPPAPSASDDSPTDVLQTTQIEADDAKTEALQNLPQPPAPPKPGFKIITDETVTHLGTGKQES